MCIRDSYWTQWEALSGWTENVPLEDRAEFSRSLDNTQFYLTEANFAETFSTTNSGEDFASMFKLFFTPDSQADLNNLFNKTVHLNILLDSIRLF